MTDKYVILLIGKVLLQLITEPVKFGILAAKILNQPELTSDPRFATNNARVANRTELLQTITNVLMTQKRDYWLQKFTGLGYISCSFPKQLHSQ